MTTSLVIALMPGGCALSCGLWTDRHCGGMSSADPTATDSGRGGILGSRAEVMNLFKELLYMLSFLLIIGY